MVRAMGRRPRQLEWADKKKMQLKKLVKQGHGGTHVEIIFLRL